MAILKEFRDPMTDAYPRVVKMHSAETSVGKAGIMCGETGGEPRTRLALQRQALAAMPRRKINRSKLRVQRTLHLWKYPYQIPVLSQRALVVSQEPAGQ